MINLLDRLGSISTEPIRLLLSASLEGKRVETEDDIRAINLRIIEIADKLGKPVVATCDAHYDKPESAIYRNCKRIDNQS